VKFFVDSADSSSAWLAARRRPRLPPARAVDGVAVRRRGPTAQARVVPRGEVRGGRLFLFDEPTTGLHHTDVEQLMKTFRDLIDRGNSVLVIEPNTPVSSRAPTTSSTSAPREGTEAGRWWRWDAGGDRGEPRSITGRYLFAGQESGSRADIGAWQRLRWLVRRITRYPTGSDPCCMIRSPRHAALKAAASSEIMEES